MRTPNDKTTLRDGTRARVAWYAPPNVVMAPIVPGDVALLTRIFRTRFCRDYDTFAAFCGSAGCCGEQDHDNACGPCGDHAALNALRGTLTAAIEQGKA